MLNLEHVSIGDRRTRAERDERFQWTIQRIRLSPQEKHLAATLKCSHKEELRYLKHRDVAYSNFCFVF